MRNLQLPRNDFTLGERSCAAQTMSVHSTHYTTGQMETCWYSAHIISSTKSIGEWGSGNLVTFKLEGQWFLPRGWLFFKPVTIHSN